MDRDSRVRTYAIENVVFVRFPTTQKQKARGVVDTTPTEPSCRDCSLLELSPRDDGQSCWGVQGRRSSNEASFLIPQLELERF
jgi:hypothetical protein